MGDKYDTATCRDRDEGAMNQRSLTLDSYGFDARNHATAEGIEAKAWHPDMSQQVALGTVGVAARAVMEVLDDVE